MILTIKCYARFKEVFGEETVLEISSPATIKTAVTELAQRGGDDGSLIIDESGNIRDYIMIVHNGVRITPEETDETGVADGDELILFPPVSGG